MSPPWRVSPGEVSPSPSDATVVSVLCAWLSIGRHIEVCRVCNVRVLYHLMFECINCLQQIQWVLSCLVVSLAPSTQSLDSGRWGSWHERL